MEPAAMLGGAFQIEVGRPFQVRAVLQRECVRRARVEPDVENVADLRPAFAGARSEEAFTRTLRKPGIGAFLFEGFEDAGIDRFVLQYLALLIDEDADRDAPGALTDRKSVV